MKFAKCIYARFANSVINLKLIKGDVFAVTPEIAESQVFSDGLNTKNFIMVEIRTRPEMRKVVNLTEAMEEEFEKRLAEQAEAEKAEAEAEQEQVDEEATPDPPAEAAVDEIVEEVLDSTTSDVGTDGDAVITSPGPPEEEEPPVAFTEIAGNVDNALKAIAKETDIEKLKFALREDERKSVKKAIVARLKELEE